MGLEALLETDHNKKIVSLMKVQKLNLNSIFPPNSATQSSCSLKTMCFLIYTAYRALAYFVIYLDKKQVEIRKEMILGVVPFKPASIRADHRDPVTEPLH